VEWIFEVNTDDYFFERSIGLQIILLFPMIERCRAGQIGRCLILACLILHWSLVFLMFACCPPSGTAPPPSLPPSALGVAPPPPCSPGSPAPARPRLLTSRSSLLRGCAKKSFTLVGFVILLWTIRAKSRRK